jgi:DNA-binding transcriptional MocR family regulator
MTKSADIADRLRARIHDGTLGHGDLVPSSRALAEEWGVSRGTVVAAYEQLDGEGYLRARPGAGTRVIVTTGADPAGSATVSARVDDPSDGLRGTAARASASVEAPPIRIDLGPGLPRVTAISPRDWRAAWRHAAAQPFRDEFADARGTQELRQRIAAQLSLTRAVDATADDVVITSGTSETLSLVAEALRVASGRSPRIAVEDPGYRTGQRALVSAGAVVTGVGLVDGGIDLDEVARRHTREAFDAVMVTPSHQYPLGGSMAAGRRLEMLAWAAQHRVTVIEDDYDSDFRHRGQPLPALAALDRAGAVIHVGSFSKTLDPRLRCGYLVLPCGRGGGRAGEGGRSGVAGGRPGPDGVRAALLSARVARGPAVGQPVQDAVAHLLASGAYRRHLGRVRRDYSSRRDAIAAWADRPDVAAAGVVVGALDGGLHAVVEWSGGPSGLAVRDRLRVEGIRLQDLADYRLAIAAGDSHGVVLGYGAVSSLQLTSALDALGSALGRP